MAEVRNLQAPSAVGQFIDPKTGVLTILGHRFLQLLWERTGGSSGGIIYDTSDITQGTSASEAQLFAVRQELESQLQGIALQLIEQVREQTLDPSALIGGVSEGGLYQQIIDNLLVNADHIDFSLTPLVGDAVGRLVWNDTDGTLNLGLKGGSVVLQLGQEQLLRCLNKSGGNFVDGQAVFISGAQGNRTTVELADADLVTAHKTIGIVTEHILNNQEGFVTINGMVRSIDTSAWADGDQLWVSSTAGALTNVQPAPPKHSTSIGYVVRSHAVNGSIFVSTQAGIDLTDCDDVLISGVANNDALIYDSGTTLWKNRASTGSGSNVLATSPVLVTPTLGVASGTSLNLSGAFTTTGLTTLQNGSITVSGGADNGLTTRTNATMKVARFESPHYLAAEESFLWLTTIADATANTLDFGGNSGTKNTATQIRFYTAANNTTLSGTQSLVINSTNTTIPLSTASTTSATGALVVTGGVGVGGAITGASTVTGTSFIPTGSSVPANGLYLPAANTIGFSTNSTGRGRVTANGQLVMGGASVTAQSGLVGGTTITPTVQNVTTTVADGFQSTRYSVTSSAANGLIFGKSQNTVIDSFTTAVSSGSLLGYISFNGSDTAKLAEAARINGETDGTAGLNDMPGRLTFLTSADGSATPTERLRIDSSGNVLTVSTGGLGYGTGSGGAVTQVTSRTTGVTLNKTNGAITLFSAAGTTSWQSFTVTNSTVAATDVIHLAQKSGTDLYQLFVTAVAAGSFRISFATTGGTTTEQPVINFAVIKAVTA